MEAVLVFKTSIEKQEDIQVVTPLLNKLLGKTNVWNFDLEDCDKILRITNNRLDSNTIEQALQQKGYFCEELED